MVQESFVYGQECACRVIKEGGIACLIGPVHPTFWLSRLFADVWMLFPTEDEYMEVGLLSFAHCPSGLPLLMEFSLFISSLTMAAVFLRASCPYIGSLHRHWLSNGVRNPPLIGI
jgi:hypothetical protein